MCGITTLGATAMAGPPQVFHRSFAELPNRYAVSRGARQEVWGQEAVSFFDQVHDAIHSETRGAETSVTTARLGLAARTAVRSVTAVRKRLRDARQKLGAGEGL
jgi:hypothetical protein